MEIKASLQKPYTEEERDNFIFNYGQNCFGKNPQTYEIKETETALEAWGKTDEDYAKEREEQFNKDFFNTSFGYIRRKATMATGEIKDFLSDLLPSIAIGVQMGKPAQIIAYDKPDFTQEITDWTVLQNEKTATDEFVQECFTQLNNDFKPVEVADDNTTDVTY